VEVLHFLIGEGQVEGFLHGHADLHHVQRVRTEVRHDPGFQRDLDALDSKLLHEDVLDLRGGFL
jgi:hypothetical protein